MAATTPATKTSRGGGAPVELDLNSFLRAHGGDLFSSSSEDDDDDDAAVRRRTVDEILLDSDVSSASSTSRSPSPPKAIPATPNPNFNAEDEQHKIFDGEQRPNLEPQEEPSTSFDWRRRSRELSTATSLPSLAQRSYARGGATSSASSRPLSSLLGGVRPNPKPGAALAAAAAASRTVPTPHAAAIKIKRANTGSASMVSEEPVLFSEESASSEEYDVSELSEGNDVNTFLDIDADERETLRSSSSEVKQVAVLELLQVETAPEVCGDHASAKELEPTVKSDTAVGMTVLPGCATDGESLLEDENRPVTEEANAVEENMVVDKIESKLEVPQVPLKVPQLEGDDIDRESYPGEEVLAESEYTQVEETDIDRLVEETLAQLENNRKAAKKAEKKLRASMKPLEWAEELEKRNASSGLHWEEGAAAQPMRLEGIRRGPPAVGYMQMDLDNAITRALSTQSVKRDHGSPQVVAVHMNYIALGMLRGSVLVFPSKYSAHSADGMESKMLIFGSHGEKSQTPVTSMCFNQQGNLLLVGHNDGHVTLWDVQRALPAKVITGEHVAAVVHTFFLGQDPEITRQFKIVTGDCKGRVLLHAVSVVPLVNRFSISSQCLFDGQKTATVLSACPLIIDDSGGFGYSSAQGNTTTSTNGLGSMVGGVVGVVGKDAGWKLFNEGSSVMEEGVVIFVTHQNALVAKLSPTVEVFEKLSKPDGVREGSMPYAAWRWTTNTHHISHESSDRVSWLAIAWDRKVQVSKLVKSDLKRHVEWNLDSAALGVTWLDDQMLVVLTQKGHVCLFSKDGSEIHRTSFLLGGLGIDDIITYNTHFTNTFGNPEKAYHKCIAVRGATIYILGPLHLMVSRLLPWKERIQVLQRAGDWMGALDMSMRLYDGHAHGVIDLPGTVDTIREIIMPFLLELILSYVDEVFSYISVALCNQIGKLDLLENQESADTTLRTEIENQYGRVGGVAVEFCIHIKRTDILFDTIFSKFVAVQHGGTFLEILEPYILKDMLGALPPEIMQALVEHYSSRGWLQRVEQCVLHMDISSLDFNQVVRLCREHGLYGALIYLFSRGLGDFKTPLEELLMVVQNSPKPDATAIGYRMLIYLKYSFEGLAFPPGHGTLDSSSLKSVRTELLQFLLEDSKSVSSQAFKSFKASSGTCPNLCHLLLLDTEATLEVLGCAFQDLSIQHKEVDNLESLECHNIMVQTTINTLVNILDLESEVIRSFVVENKDEIWPSKKDLGHLLEFIAFFASCQKTSISRRVLKHILDYLTSYDLSLHASNSTNIASQIEKQVLILLKVVPQSDWNSEDVLHRCTNAKFYQACGLIHATKGQYVAALDSYMKDQNEPYHTFAFIYNTLLHLKSTEASEFQSAVISRIPELVKLSRECAFFLVIDQFCNQSQDILSKLHSYPESLFLLLKSAIDVHLGGKLNFPLFETVQISNTPFGKITNKLIELEVYAERVSDLPKLLHHNAIQITDELTELYLKLLCRFERKAVLKFLETFDNYRLEPCLQLCLEYEVTDAAAYLLERVGDVSSALALLMTGLKEKIDLLVAAVENVFSETAASDYLGAVELADLIKMNEVAAVRDVLHAAVGLCQRNTQRLDSTESESLWFRLLDSYSEPLKRFCRSKDAQLDKEPLSKCRQSYSLTVLRKLFSQFIGEIIEGMSGHVVLPVIMAKILSDNGSQEFGDFKLTIQRMLGTYGYERRILGAAKSLIEDDTFYTLSLLKKGASHAYAPQDFLCCICGCSLTKDSSTSQIRIFSCGHATHLHCESYETKKDVIIGCPICLPKSNVSRSKSFFVGNGLVKNSTSSSQTSEGVRNVQHLHEPDCGEKSFGIQQFSRFEILSNLQKPRKTLQIDTLPQLRLSPPAIYHEKIQHRTSSLMGEQGGVSVKNEKANKRFQLKERKSRGTLNSFPLKSSIFGYDKNKVK